MKWSRYPEKKQIVSKSHTNMGKLYYANKFTYAQQLVSSPQSLWVGSARCILSYSGTRCGPDFHIWGLYLCTYELGEGEWPPDFYFYFFFPKQLWHLPVDQGKNQIMPNSSVPHPHVIKKHKLVASSSASLPCLGSRTSNAAQQENNVCNSSGLGEL